MIDNPDPATPEEAKHDAVATARLQQRRADVEGALSVVSTLTAKDRRFLAAFLMGDSLKDAYLHANPGYTGNNARKLGWQWRHKEKIQSAIDEYFHAQEMSAAEVVARLSQQAKAQYAAYLRPNGSVDLESLLADGLGHLISGFKNTQYGLNVEFYDAHTALVDIGRYHGMFKDRTETHETSWRDELAELLRNGRITEADVTAECSPGDAQIIIARARLAARAAGGK